MKRPAQITDLLDRIAQDYPEHYNYAITQFGGRTELAGILFLQFACIDYVDNSKDRPKEVFKIDYEKQLQVLLDQLDQIANHLGAVAGECISEDELTQGEDTLAKACIRKIDKLIPNGERLGELIDEVQKHILPSHEILGRSQCHHLGKRLYAKIKDTQ